MIDSYSFPPDGYERIIVFKDREIFEEVLAANPHMTAIMGADDHTREEFPGVFIAGLNDSDSTKIRSPMDTIRESVQKAIDGIAKEEKAAS